MDPSRRFFESKSGLSADCADYRIEQDPTFLISENLCKSEKSVDEKSRYAAGKRTTFFLPRPMMLVGGTKVTSTYFFAQAIKSRLQLRSSLCLMCSRWLSMVFTLKSSDCAIWLLPRPEPNKKKMCISRSDNFSMPMAGRAERCSDRVSSDFLNARIATS